MLKKVLFCFTVIVMLLLFVFRNPLLTKDVKNTTDFMALNLKYLGQMKNLTEIHLKGLSGIKLIKLSSFKNLKNLNTLVSF